MSNPPAGSLDADDTRALERVARDEGESGIRSAVHVATIDGSRLVQVQMGRDSRNALVALGRTSRGEARLVKWGYFRGALRGGRFMVQNNFVGGRVELELIGADLKTIETIASWDDHAIVEVADGIVALTDRVKSESDRTRTIFISTTNGASFEAGTRPVRTGARLEEPDARAARFATRFRALSRTTPALTDDEVYDAANVFSDWVTRQSGFFAPSNYTRRGNFDYEGGRPVSATRDAVVFQYRRTVRTPGYSGLRYDRAADDRVIALRGDGSVAWHQPGTVAGTLADGNLVLLDTEELGVGVTVVRPDGAIVSHLPIVRPSNVTEVPGGLLSVQTFDNRGASASVLMDASGKGVDLATGTPIESTPFEWQRGEPTRRVATKLIARTVRRKSVAGEKESELLELFDSELGTATRRRPQTDFDQDSLDPFEARVPDALPRDRRDAAVKVAEAVRGLGLAAADVELTDGLDVVTRGGVVRVGRDLVARLPGRTVTDLIAHRRSNLELGRRIPSLLDGWRDIGLISEVERRRLGDGAPAGRASERVIRALEGKREADTVRYFRGGQGVPGTPFDRDPATRVAARVALQAFADLRAGVLGEATVER